MNLAFVCPITRRDD